MTHLPCFDIVLLTTWTLSQLHWWPGVRVTLVTLVTTMWVTTTARHCNNLVNNIFWNIVTAIIQLVLKDQIFQALGKILFKLCYKVKSCIMNVDIFSELDEKRKYKISLQIFKTILLIIFHFSIFCVICFSGINFDVTSYRNNKK